MLFRKFLEKINRSPSSRRWLRVVAAVCAATVAIPLVLFLLTWGGIFGKLPNSDELLLIQNPLASEVYSADSVLIGKYYIQERSNLKFEELPAHVIDALLATEDVRFFEHGGVDYRSIGRVFFKGFLLGRESAGGGSTITQQLAKNLYPRKRFAILSLPINKFREIIIARRIEKSLSKEAILSLYLNTIPFGDNTYGLQAAANRFFSVSAKSLSVDEAALLVGMLKATHSYNPRVYPVESKNRRNTVLDQMRKYEMLSEDSARLLAARPLVLRYQKVTNHEGPAPYFREHLRAELVRWCETYNESAKEPINLYTAGLKIYTTIDSRMQAYAEQAVAIQMKTIQSRFNQEWKGTELLKENQDLIEESLRKSATYRNLKARGISQDSIDALVDRPVLMTVFDWEGEKEVNMSPRDSVRHHLLFLHAGMLAIDPDDGAVRIWVGGINHQYFQYDHVKSTTRRQVGSTFKPIVYAAAIEGGIKPCTFISSEKTVYDNMEGWAPQNTDNRYDLKYSMPGALVYSVNTVSVKILERAGIDQTVGIARKMGIASPLTPVPSMALGSADVSMMEMVTAYACFANRGLRPTPYYITAITTRDGSVLEQFHANVTEQAISDETASLVLQMMRRVVNEGTASSLRSRFGLFNDIAGKTGTTQSNTDGWFVGVMPNLVVGTWVGADNPIVHFRTTTWGQGARTALPIVGSFFTLANHDRSLDSITRVRFPQASANVQRKLSCDLYKTDRNLIRKLSGRKEKKRDFGEKRSGLLRKLFRRDK